MTKRFVTYETIFILVVFTCCAAVLVVNDEERALERYSGIISNDITRNGDSEALQNYEGDSNKDNLLKPQINNLRYLYEIQALKNESAMKMRFLTCRLSYYLRLYRDKLFATFILDGLSRLDDLCDQEANENTRNPITFKNNSRMCLISGATSATGKHLKQSVTNFIINLRLAVVHTIDCSRILFNFTAQLMRNAYKRYNSWTQTTEDLNEKFVEEIAPSFDELCDAIDNEMDKSGDVASSGLLGSMSYREKRSHNVCQGKDVQVNENELEPLSECSSTNMRGSWLKCSCEARTRYENHLRRCNDFSARSFFQSIYKHVHRMDYFQKMLSLYFRTKRTGDLSRSAAEGTNSYDEDIKENGSPCHKRHDKKQCDRCKNTGEKGYSFEVILIIAAIIFTIAIVAFLIITVVADCCSKYK
ncbi:hypothetical protein VCUG_01705 [Vavraia culicis subsp. floridensis]|uniref:Uncharacterized protein n=1 Tax=Vavraia culicis (isolate floridensis) TaxID=948595 RepID=L2GUM7_VAVCU|nr:uncharacterized protein VCUG_01705 [Vavraia culicis subsp. floridensis]ELA46805.1 hypothetical protein VCUG_01705 [Vavraia culicis subsp. floridensis]